jgi:methylthioribose-1-phosphate isomerase
VPFVVAAPLSTIDFAAPDGAAITIEHRAAEEVTSFAGTPVAAAGSPAYNPAFDITPPALLTALVTERGVARPVNAGTLRDLETDNVAGSDQNTAVRAAGEVVYMER